MIAKKLRRLLLCSSGKQPAHQQNHDPRRSPAKTFTFVSGRNMTPRGCECLLSLAELRHGKDGRLATHVLRRRRALVAGVAPGDLLRTAPLFFASAAAHSDDPLAAPQRCHALKPAQLPQQVQQVGSGGGYRPAPSSPSPSTSPRGSPRQTLSSTRLVAVPHRRLPCAAAGSPAQCQRCPWMALSTETASSVKAELVRAALDTALAAEGQRPSLVSYLEPFSAPVESHFLQEAELAFVRGDAAHRSGMHYPGTSAVRGSHGDGAQGRFRYVTRPPVRRGPPNRGVPEDYCRSRAADAAAPGMEGVANSADSVLDCCPLATLEQKRLGQSLTRWARQLPAPMRAALVWAYVSQPAVDANSTYTNGSTHRGEKSAEAAVAHPWDAALLVTLVVRPNAEDGEGQSPFCGPAHPAELLSVEEQKLVDAVLEAAPLVRHIAVHLTYLPEPSRHGRGQIRPEELVDCLYPVTERGLRIVDALKATASPANPVGSAARRALGPRRCVTAVLPTSARPVFATVPGLHSAVLARGLLQRTTADNTDTTSGRVEDFPCASFWRQRHALSTTCSVLLSILTETVNINDDGEADAAVVKEHIGSNVRLRPPSLSALAAAPASAPAAILLSQALAALLQTTTQLPSERATSSSSLGSGTSSTSFPESRAIAVVLGGAGTEAEMAGIRAEVRSIMAANDSSIGEPIRVLLVQCSLDMTVTALGRAAAMLAADGGCRVKAIEAGVVDVDPLSAAFVGYTLLTLSSPCSAF